MAFDFSGGMTGSGIGDLLGAGLSLYGMGNYNDPSQAGMPYFSQIQQQLPSYFQPYINAGNSALPALQQQYGQLLRNPNAIMSQIGSGYHASPGYNWQVNQALGAANRAAAAGGMIGSPEEQQNIAGTVNQLANQDYYNYLNHGLGLYGMGLQGMGDLAHLGYGASSNLGEDLASSLMSQAQLAYAGAANKNQAQQGTLGDIGGLISGGLGALGFSGIF